VGVGTPSGDIAHVRVLADVPTPTTVVACSAYTSKVTCEAQPACQWKSFTTGPNKCVNK
jgi:hypothetical protein